MIRKAPNLSTNKTTRSRSSERGAALVTAIMILGMLSAITITVLAVVSRKRKSPAAIEENQTFYAAAAGIEKMTTDFSALFQVTSQPTAAS